ncbi:MAG: TonB-dependent receptor plug domain-containing protein [Flavobacteriales bacterium]|nr:TonB-dependent receptor plug domain-containing protein [Flavobacteriales bacterium]
MRIIKTISVTLLLATINVNAQTDSTASNNGDTITAPTFTTSLDELEGDSEGQDVSGLLQSSKDVFSNIAGFNFSAARYRVRGYDSENFRVSMNGVNLNGPEGGRAIWAFWGGLNDITRYQESKAGISASSYGFGGIGGFSNIDARATAVRKGTKVSYALANRSYSNRLMVTHATGMMKNGWAIAVSASKRWSDEGYVDGTYYNGASYFLSVEKKVNDKHTLGFVGFGAPTIQGKRSISTQETYDLTGNNYYNSYWGYQNGKKRNSRVRNTHKPMAMLNHYFKMNDKTTINSSAFYSFGKQGNTRLNWYNAADPRPDYYRYLPSFYNAPGDEAQFDLQTSLWQSNDPTTTQLDFDQMYFSNTKNLYTQTNVDGIIGNDITGNRAKYIIEEARKDVTHYGFNTVVSHKQNDKLMMTGGLNISLYKSNNYKLVNDLLGADFWIDVDQFAERDFADESVAQSDVNNPNRIIKEGDRFGYDYDININTYNGFGQVEGLSKKIDWFAALSLTSTSFWRTGNYKSGLFPENSFGDSEKQSFFNYGLKAGAVYKLTGRHLIRLNGAFLTRAPFSRTAFVSPRTRDQVVPNLKSEKIMSGDISYIVRYPKVKTRATLFHTTIKDKTWSRSFYHDELNTFVNYMMTGVDQVFTGIEIGAEVKVISTVTVSGAFATGKFLYDSRPTATIIQDNSTNSLAENKTIYFKNYRIGGIPQTAASIGVQYRSPKYWFTGINFNYFANIYLDANPDRRTEEAISKYVSSDPQVSEIVDQTKLDNDYSINLFAGKSWRIKNKYYIRLNINVNNVLDNTDFKTGGFEQLRYDQNEIGKFPPKLGYMYGRTFFAMVSFSF